MTYMQGNTLLEAFTLKDTNTASKNTTEVHHSVALKPGLHKQFLCDKFYFLG